MAASEERRDLCADTGTPEHSPECRAQWVDVRDAAKIRALNLAVDRALADRRLPAPDA